MRNRVLLVAHQAIDPKLPAAPMIAESQPLAQADGTPAATKLPLDASSAQVAFETATFGLG